MSPLGHPWRVVARFAPRASEPVLRTASCAEGKEELNDWVLCGRGSLDVTHPSSAIGPSNHDVRLTTRVEVADFGLATTLDEPGHGMDHQGPAPELEATVLADGASAGVHERRSRLVESVIGRSRAYLDCAPGACRRPSGRSSAA